MEQHPIFYNKHALVKGRGKYISLFHALVQGKILNLRGSREGFFLRYKVLDREPMNHLGGEKSGIKNLKQRDVK